MHFTVILKSGKQINSYIDCERYKFKEFDDVMLNTIKKYNLTSEEFYEFGKYLFNLCMSGK